jgi:regulator of protease activity HflC (stomatin/prohibitin superfamily)
LFEPLLDKLAEYADRLTPIHIMREYEGGVLLRLGKFKVVPEPGPVWKVPVIDELLTCQTNIETTRLEPQTLTTKDSKQVGIRAFVKWKVEKPREYLLQLDHANQAIEDFTMGCIKQQVESHTFDELISEDIEKKVLADVRKECNQYGLKIFKITFTDMGITKTLRLMFNLPEVEHG